MLGRWNQRDQGSDQGSEGKFVSKGENESSRGTCGYNDGVGEGGDKSGQDDGTSELGEDGRYQYISDGGWVVVARKGG